MTRVSQCPISLRSEHPVEFHTSKHLAKIVLDMTDMLGSDIMNCRTLSFRSSASMSGKYSGLQAKTEK
jgi:hypothetical protein